MSFLYKGKTTVPTPDKEDVKDSDDMVPPIVPPSMVMGSQPAMVQAIRSPETAPCRKQASALSILARWGVPRKVMPHTVQMEKQDNTQPIPSQVTARRYRFPRFGFYPPEE